LVSFERTNSPEIEGRERSDRERQDDDGGVNRAESDSADPEGEVCPDDLERRAEIQR